MFFSNAIEIKEFTPELLIFLLSIVQSLFFEYVPKVEAWYAKLDEKTKRLVQAGLLLVITLAIFGMSCGGLIGGIECSGNSLWGLIIVYFMALTVNQGTHLVFKKPSAA